MIKQITLVALGTLIISTASAKVGIGVGISSESATIFLPVDLGQYVRIEPAFEYQKYDRSEEYSDLNRTDEATYAELSLGLFGRFTVYENLKGYAGLRLGYNYESNESTRVSTSGTEYTERDLQGYSIAPTLGFEYFFVENFSLGGEVSWYYRALDGDITVNQIPVSGTPDLMTGDTENTRTGTHAKLLARFYF